MFTSVDTALKHTARGMHRAMHNTGPDAMDAHLALPCSSSRRRLLLLSTDFKGPPDPLRGDAPYARVRDEAKECINAVFNGPAARQSGGPSLVSGRMEGYGGGGDPSMGSPTSEMNSGRASNFGYEGTYSSSNPNSRAGANPNPGLVTNDPPVSTGKMVGFGNPQYENKTSSASFIDKMKTKMTAAASSDAKGAGPYKPYAGAGGYANPSTFTPPPIAALDQSNGGRKRGEVGGVWANGGDAGSASQGAGSYPGSSSAISGTPYANSVAHVQHQPRVVRPTSSNGEYETRLIDSLTPAAGVRSVPSKDELSKFAQQCESLDKLLVVKIINESKLAPGTHPATQMKALCLIECILTTGNAAATEEVEDYLCENASNLETLEREGSTSLLKNKAVRVMELCGLREEKRVQQAPTTAAQPAASSFYQQQAKPEVDLLGFAAAAPAAAPAASPSSGSAFGFLDPSDSGSSNGGGGGGDMFGSLEVKQPAAAGSAPAAASPQHDPFDLFTTPSNTNKPASSPQSSVPSSSASAPGPLDFMNSSSSSAPSGAKVDPLTALMSNTRLSAHPQPRAPQQQMQMQMQQPMMGGVGGGPGVFGASGGMAGFAPRNTMPPLGPPQQMQGGGYPGQGYPQQQQGGFPQQGGYAPQGYPAQQGFAPQQMGFQAAPNPAANQNLLFQVKAAGSNGGGSGFPGSSQLPAHMRPSIELDSAGNPIVLGGPSASPTATTAPGSSAFGFVSAAGTGDSFGFVNDMMASNK